MPAVISFNTFNAFFPSGFAMMTEGRDVSSRVFWNALKGT